MPPRSVYLTWIGDSGEDPALLERARAHLEDVFEAPTRVGYIADRPTLGYDARRNQYLSTDMLRFVLGHVPSDARKVLAITDRDLFVAVLTFVFGEAQMGGTAAVVSTARLAFGAGGLPVEPRLFQARFLKECAHELGHAFGLIHCRSPRCVMSRSNTILDVDQKNGDLCPDCQRHLWELLAKENG